MWELKMDILNRIIQKLIKHTCLYHGTVRDVFNQTSIATLETLLKERKEDAGAI